MTPYARIPTSYNLECSAFDDRLICIGYSLKFRLYIHAQASQVYDNSFSLCFGVYGTSRSVSR